MHEYDASRRSATQPGPGCRGPAAGIKYGSGVVTNACRAPASWLQGYHVQQQRLLTPAGTPVRNVVSAKCSLYDPWEPRALGGPTPRAARSRCKHATGRSSAGLSYARTACMLGGVAASAARFAPQAQRLVLSDHNTSNPLVQATVIARPPLRHAAAAATKAAPCRMPRSAHAAARPRAPPTPVLVAAARGGALGTSTAAAPPPL